ncbi:acyltransferase domain-containing protein [Thermomonospora umbrina]|uniref:Acyl transferase family protein n=1 Tax=Thermomonospora umbrina TaxID=111806 RepID=A0A3D9SZA3_9ACTN|nr:acyltransferase domain-containing protein [Thermomonospora umbrina]REE99383.1 acyl transferase family protein [Thermomonospora umbrina]
MRDERVVESAGVGEGSEVVERPAGRLVFAYSGLGSVWPGMGRGLLAEPVAARILERCEELVRQSEGWSLLEQVTAGREVCRLGDPTVAQPALFAMQAALTELWRSWGVDPDAIVGTSVGEIAAAYAAGALDLEVACRVAVCRGRAVGSMSGSGSMAVVGMSARDIGELIGSVAGRLWVAVDLSPAHTLIAGDREAVAAVGPLVRERGATWELRYPDHPLHSPLMEPARRELAALENVVPRTPDRPIFSSLTGGQAPPGAYGPVYWARTLVSPVLLQDAVLAATADGPATVVEIGPRASLTPMMRLTLAARRRPATVLPSMSAHADARGGMLEAAARLSALRHRPDLVRPSASARESLRRR